MNNQKFDKPEAETVTAAVVCTFLESHGGRGLVETGAAFLLDDFEERLPQPRGAIERLSKMKHISLCMRINQLK